MSTYKKPFLTAIAEEIWRTKYCWVNHGQDQDRSVEGSWQRVAKDLASVEAESGHWQGQFSKLLEGFRFLPGGRILANAGTSHDATLFNCFVMGQIEDSMDGIFSALKEGALTMQKGGGVGYDFSSLRPNGVEAHTSGRIASGPVSFMRIWNTMCATILTTGARRGAMMATLRCDHPDIEEFVTAKHRKDELTHFNLSVLVTDNFIKAVRENKKWDLVFPTDGSETLRVHKTVQARELWQTILKSTYEYSEPGVLFIDRINRDNNLYYKESISATNPCGEIPLPPYGACDLGSVNLTAFVKDAFSKGAQFNFAELKDIVPAAVRFLDNVIDRSHFPLGRQKEMALGTRRIGLGVTGLADCLAMLGMSYGSAEAREWSAELMKTICIEAYGASIELAKEKGPFPFFEMEKYLESPFIQRLPVDIKEGIKAHGLRNSHLLAIAPTGTISLLANNVSSGVEPIFSLRFERGVLEPDGTTKKFEVKDFAVDQWEASKKEPPPPELFVTTYDLSAEQHLKMQAALQGWVDNSISKTINVAAEISFEDFGKVYDMAYDLGLKGCTTYRPNDVRGAVLKCY